MILQDIVSLEKRTLCEYNSTSSKITMTTNLDFIERWQSSRNIVIAVDNEVGSCRRAVTFVCAVTGASGTLTRER